MGGFRGAGDDRVHGGRYPGIEILTGGPMAASTAPAPLTLGVEEEFLLVDPDTGSPAPVAPRVRRRLDPAVARHSRLEFHADQIEMASPVCTGLAELRRHLTRLRRAAAAAAEAEGVRLIAAGTQPLHSGGAPVTATPRYTAMARRAGHLAGDPSVCGCHVHVGVPDRDTAVRVGTSLRAWLPVLQALAANSPLAGGVDTGHASWRSTLWRRWPSVGPAPHLRDLRAYERAVAELTSSSPVVDDEAMLYWYARPSTSYPTVEVRVADVCLTVDDAVLVAALVRGLVGTALERLRGGGVVARVDGRRLAAAHRRAARYGLEGTLADPRDGRVRPAADVLAALVRRVRPALTRYGDMSTVERQLDRLRREGPGYARQRRLLRRTGGGRAMVEALAARTVAAPMPG
jgi:carboxylate-amine ligase